jgi:hypothetical protein
LAGELVPINTKLSKFMDLTYFYPRELHQLQVINFLQYITPLPPLGNLYQIEIRNGFERSHVHLASQGTSGTLYVIEGDKLYQLPKNFTDMTGVHAPVFMSRYDPNTNSNDYLYFDHTTPNLQMRFAIPEQARDMFLAHIDPGCLISRTIIQKWIIASHSLLLDTNYVLTSGDMDTILNNYDHLRDFILKAPAELISKAFNDRSFVPSTSNDKSLILH